MKKITERQIKKLTLPRWRGRQPKSPAFYKELESLKVGETWFLSRAEWKELGYRTKTFREWWTSAKNQERKGHRSSLSGIKLEVHTFVEGWTIKKLKG